MENNVQTCVAIVAPSGYAPDEAAYGRGLDRLRAAGCDIREYYVPSLKHQRFGGCDEERVKQLHAAARDPDAQMVMAVRGGYGLSRILPALDLDLLAACGKLFVGHSDFTALHMALLARGAASFAGPMVCIDYSRDDPSDFTLDHFWSCLKGPSHVIAFETPGGCALEAEGVLWGGNLTMLTHLIGTPWMPRVDGGILFLEDVNEHPYRIERMLLQMLYAGLLDQKAIVLGDFSGGPLTSYDNGYGIDAMLTYLRERIGVPILAGLPFGHIRDKATLAVGSRARLVCDGRAATLEMRGYKSLATC
ncbi:MAG TPA: muramoyltetrapeptide carboxypeptidase [Noviherbaspirillum sp.]|uniref:muramoyltetrapeptide carboxypeptidase n=1 Tax=Noviherbaspirillum sp. TaxID=1926288 RepID=UPI002D50F338|nr:muramoyltetrapeptide carboxypeptidase [Noviherbaspirillum sp.]HYD95747.1 muramoyltetrapeptide carboxypeptidase [Noviherbaspirillum sp.]